jgi:small subunit ribosomal protein S1
MEVETAEAGAEPAGAAASAPEATEEPREAPAPEQPEQPERTEASDTSPPDATKESSETPAPERQPDTVAALSDAPEQPQETPAPEREEGVAEPAPQTSDATPRDETAKETARAAPASKQAEAEPHPRRRTRFPELVRAFRSKRPIEGTVAQVIKGGYEVRVGKARGFCPHSQIDLHREDEPERQIGKTYTFKITQLRRGGEDVVLSRRAVLEEERGEEAKAVRATLIEGAVMQGHVVGTAPFGAFVDLGAGVLGLVHISELSHKRIQSVEDAVAVGDTVRVRVLKLKESGRISLSIRRAEEDPWTDVDSRFEVGKVYPGTVQRLAGFGAFVELAPGIEALAPASEFPPASQGWSDGLEVGSERDWHVLSVDAKARRVSVTLPGEAVPPEKLDEGAELKGQVQRIERYGVFVWLGPGLVGLMPRAMTGLREGDDLRHRFRVGDSVEVTVVEIGEGGRRVRLARKGARIEREGERRQPRQPPQERSEQEPPSSFGTSLADKLRAALERKDERS